MVDASGHYVEHNLFAYRMTRSFCAEAVRADDNDRYLCAILAPEPPREALLALYAFNIEIAKTRESVSEPMVGEIRLQWWREAIEELYAGRVRRHAVVGPLAQAVGTFGLPRAPLDALIDARSADLDDVAPTDLAALETYGEATSGELTRLALHICGGKGVDAETAAKHVGTAWALVGLLRSVPHHARDRRQYLPTDLVEAAGVDRGDLFELRGGDAIASVVRQVADAARGHLEEARSGASSISRACLPAVLPATLADAYLRCLERQRYDVFKQPIALSQPHRQIRLLWANMRGRF